MAMAITMRMVARIFFFATEVTQGPLSSLHYTHIKRTPKSRCAICNGCEDTAKMQWMISRVIMCTVAVSPGAVCCVLYECIVVIIIIGVD